VTNGYGLDQFAENAGVRDDCAVEVERQLVAKRLEQEIPGWAGAER